MLYQNRAARDFSGVRCWSTTPSYLRQLFVFNPALLKTLLSKVGSESGPWSYVIPVGCRLQGPVGCDLGTLLHSSTAGLQASYSMFGCCECTRAQMCKDMRVCLCVRVCPQVPGAPTPGGSRRVSHTTLASTATTATTIRTSVRALRKPHSGNWDHVYEGTHIHTHIHTDDKAAEPTHCP